MTTLVVKIATQSHPRTNFFFFFCGLCLLLLRIPQHFFMRDTIQMLTGEDVVQRWLQQGEPTYKVDAAVETSIVPV